MKNLILEGQAPRRVLSGEDFKNCQEGRDKIVADGITDTVRFERIMADVENYNIIPYEETDAYKNGKIVEEFIQKMQQIEGLERKANRAMRGLLVAENVEDRKWLTDYHNQIQGIAATLPKLPQ